jgi:hypothetical protein
MKLKKLVYICFKLNVKVKEEDAFMSKKLKSLIKITVFTSTILIGSSIATFVQSNTTDEFKNKVLSYMKNNKYLGETLVNAETISTTVDAATIAVINAEGTRLQVSLDSARILVNNLSDSTKKTDLLNRLDALQNVININNQNTAMLNATNAVVLAENSKVQECVDKAKILVNELQESTDKTDLSNRLNVVQAEIDKVKQENLNLTEATNAVIKAQSTQTQADVDSAMTLVNNLSGSANKIALLNNLRDLQSLINNINKNTALINAINAVVLAENSKLQTDEDNAEALVDVLPEGTDKTNLSDRLKIVQSHIDIATDIEKSNQEAQKLVYAINAVVKSESTKTQVDIDSAKTLVNNLSDGIDKTALLNRLNTLQNAQNLTEATDAVIKAEDTKVQVDVDSAKTLVNNLPDGIGKTVLLNRLNIVQSSINLTNATDAVTKAENTKTQVYVDSAKILVNSLPDGIDKTVLLSRLNIVQSIVNNANQSYSNLSSAINAIAEAEDTKTQAAVDSAKTLVNTLPDGSFKTGLLNRLNTVQKIINSKATNQGSSDSTNLTEIETAKAAVAKVRNTRTQTDFDTAKALVNALKDSSDKIRLQYILSDTEVKHSTSSTATTSNTNTSESSTSVNNESDVTTAKEAVAKARSTRTQTDFDTAKALVDALKDSSDKIRLQYILSDTEVKHSTNETYTPSYPTTPSNTNTSTSVNNASDVTTAKEAVAKARSTRTQTDFDTAKALVDALKDSFDKIRLRDILSNTKVKH